MISFISQHLTVREEDVECTPRNLGSLSWFLFFRSPPDQTRRHVAYALHYQVEVCALGQRRMTRRAKVPVALYRYGRSNS